MGVWMPADYPFPPTGLEIGGRFSMGRFGWFVPKNLASSRAFPTVVPYTLFLNNTSNEFNHFTFDESVLKQL